MWWVVSWRIPMHITLMYWDVYVWSINFTLPDHFARSLRKTKPVRIFCVIATLTKPFFKDLHYQAIQTLVHLFFSNSLILPTLTLSHIMWKWKSLSPVRLCNHMDYTVHGILQARILEWVAVPFYRGSSQPRDWTQVSHIPGGLFTSWATKEAQEYIAPI